MKYGGQSCIVPFAIVDRADARYINDKRALAAYLHSDFNAEAFINVSSLTLEFAYIGQVAFDA